MSVLGNDSELILVRHTETIFNEMGIITGKMDIPLSEKGIISARYLQRILSNERIDFVFVSSLFRTKQTAIIALKVYCEENGVIPVISTIMPPNSNNNDFDILPFIVDKSIDERDYGLCEGVSKNNLITSYGKEQVWKWRRSWDIAPPNGEAFVDVFNRVKSFMNKQVIPLLKEGKNIVVFGHANSLRALIVLIENISPTDVDTVAFYNGEIKKYYYNKYKSEFVIAHT